MTKKSIMVYLKAPLKTKNVKLEDDQHFLLIDQLQEAGEKVLSCKLHGNNLRQL